VPILVFLGRYFLELGPMYATDIRQTDVRQKHSLTPPPIWGGGITVCKIHASCLQQLCITM